MDPVERRKSDHAVQKKHLWIINHHALIPSKDQSVGRHLRLAQALADYGWESTLFVASTTHPAGDQKLHGLNMSKTSIENGITTRWIRASAYGGSLPLRFLGMISFSVNILRRNAVRGVPHPDAIIGSTVHPFAALSAYVISRRINVPFIYEIRDVWPESLIDLGGLSRGHPVSRLIGLVDRYLIRKSKSVVSPLPFVDLHLSEVGHPDKRFQWIANGADIPAAWSTPVASDSGAFTYMYLGSHGRANGIFDIIDAFNIACAKLPDRSLFLRLVGDGPLKADLINYSRALTYASRISFEARVPKSDVLDRAREADCLVSNLLNKPVYRFGVSLNKYFLYLSAGRPIVTASSAPNNPVRENSAGLEVAGGDTKALAQAFVTMANSPLSTRKKFALNGQEALRSEYTFEILAKKLAQHLDSIC